MSRLIMILLYPVVLIVSCTQEFSLDTTIDSRPVVSFITPTANSVVSTNFSVTFSARAKTGTIQAIFISIDGEPFIQIPNMQPYTISVTGRQPGYPELVLYAVDSRGTNSLTNRIRIAVSAPGFTEINPGNLTVASLGSLTLGDLDGDGDPDLIRAGRDSSGNNVSMIYRNNGTGFFTEIHSGSLIDAAYSSTVLGDVDGDGDLDLILQGGTSTGPRSILYINNGSSAFTENNTNSLIGVQYGSSSLGDLDGDGDLDLILTGSGNSKIYSNDGSGNFAEINPGSLTAINYGSTSLGDLDGDGDLDLILTGSDNAIIYSNNGRGGFTEINPGTLTAVSASSTSLGDIDGDGDLDLILSGIAGPTNITKIYRNNGSAAFTEINVGSLTGVKRSTSLGDLDGDGDLDLILTGNSGGVTPISKIYLNNGSGTFTEINAGSLKAVINSSAVLGDLDGDGDLDLIICGWVDAETTRYIKIYRNDWNRGGYAPYTVPK